MFIQLFVSLTLCINLPIVSSASPFIPSPTSSNNNNCINSMSSFTSSTLPGGCPFNLKTAKKQSLLNSYDDFVSTSSKFLSVHGGSSKTLSKIEEDNKKPFLKRNYTKILLASWSVLQVVAVLGNAVRRLLPIALQPFKSINDPASTLIPMSSIHWGMYVAWIGYMIYTEGYQAFQCKFSPLVVQRAFGLNENFTILRFLLAGPYAMGLFGATKKRMIVSRAVSFGVFLVVIAVKKLPYPYRSIIDAGVVAGLTYGTLATVGMFIRGLFGKLPNVDPCLPTLDDLKKTNDDSKEIKSTLKAAVTKK